MIENIEPYLDWIENYTADQILVGISYSLVLLFWCEITSIIVLFDFAEIEKVIDLLYLTYND